MQVVNNSVPKQTEFPILLNDSVAKFIAIDKQIAKKIEYTTNFKNPISQHFDKYISYSALNTVEFKEWKRKIYVEFTLNSRKQISSVATNAANKRLDKALIKAFSQLDFNLVKIAAYDTRYKYTLVIIQEKNGKPVIKCSEKAIGYIPPIYKPCNKEITYQGLNSCNYLYISNYIYNNVDITKTTDIDIDNRHKIMPKFIIGKNGKVVAAKIESQNKDLAEAYFKALKSLPKAEKPAQLNGEIYYFGYTFPTSISNLIRNSREFNKYFLYVKDNGEPLNENIKHFIEFQYNKKERKRIERVGF